MGERSFLDIDGRPIEYEYCAAERSVDAVAPTLVFLHEGLGSIDLWRDVPSEIAAGVGGCATLVYARHGHGASGSAVLPRPVTYMHHEADVVLPALLREFGIDRPLLVGHSDGASIALLYAGAANPVTALVCLAPHVFVEPESIAGIERARDMFAATDMAGRMKRYHDDPAATFRGWNDVWLSPQFRSWNIEERLPSIDAPVLLVQGAADAYGTFAQLDAIERSVTSRVERLEIDGAGHSPHLDARADVVDAIVGFVIGLSAG